MDGKKIDIKYFYLVLGICLLLGIGLFFAMRDKSKNKTDNETSNEEIITKSVDVEYESIFNSFTSTVDIMTNYPGQTKVDKSSLSSEDEFAIIQGLLTKNDYTDSTDKTDFNDDIAKYRTIKKSTLQKLVKNYFDNSIDIPDRFTIFPYSYTLTGDNYIGEAFIGGLEGQPGWYYVADTYSLSNTNLSITGYAYYDDFGQMCSDELCNDVLSGANYMNILDYKDSLTKITVNFNCNNQIYRFENITKGE